MGRLQYQVANSDAAQKLLAAAPAPSFDSVEGLPIQELRPGLRVSIVIPALNEAKNLPHVFSSLPACHEVILVDGNSDDGTAELARALLPSIRVVLQDKHGKGDALSCGFREATGDVVVMLDADGSTDPREIPLFLAALEHGFDFAKGSRFLCGGGSTDITRIRRMGNGFLRKLVNLLFRTRYSDLCYGYNAFWVHCLPRFALDCSGFEVETLLSIRAAKAGLRVCEVPSFEHNRLHGASSLRTFRDGCKILRTILRERFWRARPTYAANVSLTGLEADELMDPAMSLSP